jgi:hypothetical protein
LKHRLGEHAHLRIVFDDQHDGHDSPLLYSIAVQAEQWCQVPSAVWAREVFGQRNGGKVEALAPDE